MRESLKTGISFGLTSGVITTLGLMVGLNAGTHLKMVVLGGILTIAIADAFSDALGIHMSEESKVSNSTKQVWESTIAAFITKFVIASSFIIPIITLDLATAIYASIIWGILLIIAVSYFVAKRRGDNPSEIVAEHLIIVLLVIIITHWVGSFISTRFN